MGFLIREKENTNVALVKLGNTLGIPRSSVVKTASTARGTGSIPGRTTEIPYAVRCSLRKKEIKKERKKYPIVLFENVI